jgi:hypothetical protein
MYSGKTLITLHVINNFLLNVVWDIKLPKILFHTKPTTSAIENTFLITHTYIGTHYPLFLIQYEQCLEHCQWSHFHDLLMNWLMKHWMAEK